MLETKQHQIAEAERLPIPTVQTIVDGKLCDAASGQNPGRSIANQRRNHRAIPTAAADVDCAVAGAQRSYRDPGRV